MAPKSKLILKLTLSLRKKKISALVLLVMLDKVENIQYPISFATASQTFFF